MKVYQIVATGRFKHGENIARVYSRKVYKTKPDIEDVRKNLNGHLQNDSSKSIFSIDKTNVKVEIIELELVEK